MEAAGIEPTSLHLLRVYIQPIHRVIEPAAAHCTWGADQLTLLHRYTGTHYAICVVADFMHMHILHAGCVQQLQKCLALNF